MVSASELDFDLTGCHDVTARALAREHGKLLSNLLSVKVQTWAQIR